MTAQLYATYVFSFEIWLVVGSYLKVNPISLSIEKGGLDIFKFSLFRNLANNSHLAPLSRGSSTVQREVSAVASQVLQGTAAEHCGSAGVFQDPNLCSCVSEGQRAAQLG